MMKNKYFPIILVILVLVAGVIYLANKNNKSQTQVSNSQTLGTPTQNLIIDSPSPTPSLTPNANTGQTQTANTNSGVTRGQIVCNYLTPPAPNQQGSANIISNWNNANIQVCVSANGNNQTLIAKDSNGSGNRTDNVNWISSGVSYVFTLYNNHSGDPVCSGTVLSSCKIGVQSSPSPTPKGRSF